jgi:putative membrane protein
MYIQRRFPFKGLISWTKKELIFFLTLSTVFTVLFEVLDIKWLQVPLTPVGLIGTAVAFMIGFQNNAAYDRIWEARKIWGGIVNSSRSLIITVKDSFYLHEPNSNNEEKDELKIITHRHIAWLTTLRYAMRTKKTWETSYDDFKKQNGYDYHTPEQKTSLEDEIKPYLSKEEYDYVMTKSNKPNSLISLQSRHLRKLTDEKKIWDFTFLNLQNILQDLTSYQGKTERIKNFPYPKQYGSVGYHFVHIFIWLLPMAIIPTFAKMGVSIAETNPILGTYFIWFNIPCTVAVIWVFNTMLRVGLAGENPFEGSPNDVPISNISRTITQDILQIIDEENQNIPEQFENRNHIQM